MENILGHRLAELTSLDPARTAVLAIHWQNDVVSPDGAFGRDFAKQVAATGIVGRAGSVFAAARTAGARVIYINVVYPPGHIGHVRNNAVFNTAADANAFVRGTIGERIITELAREPGDLEVEHTRTSGFYGNDLLTILLGAGIDTVVVTGVATNVSVDHTVRDAAQFGFRTLLVEDCCCSGSPELHAAALLSLRVLATNIVKAARVVQMFGQKG
jgi:nicotinamidase-related amidase